MKNYLDNYFDGLEDYSNTIDMSYKPCDTGCGGQYREITIQDDWNGTLHCDQCNNMVGRYRKMIDMDKLLDDYKALNRKYISLLKYDKEFLHEISKTANDLQRAIEKRNKRDY